MSNSHLFLKSAFPRSNGNGLGRYVCQLQRLTLKFCKNNGSSKGMRGFIENGLMDFAKQHPGVVVYVKPRRHRTPVIVAEYLNGDTQWINCRNNTDEEISKWMELLKSQAGDHTSVRYRKMQSTNQPSIQGTWTPFLNKNPIMNVVDFPQQSLSEMLNKEKSSSEKLLEMFQKQSLQDKK